MEVSYKALLPRQSILPNELVIEIYIEDINKIFPHMKNQQYEYIILTSKPDSIYMFNLAFNKNGLYGHSSFPQLNNEIYINELNNELNCIQKKYMVKYAGRIIFDNIGKLKTWNNSSGHYKPNYMDAHIIGLDMNKFNKFIKFSWAKKVI